MICSRRTVSFALCKSYRYATTIACQRRPHLSNNPSASVYRANKILLQIHNHPHDAASNTSTTPTTIRYFATKPERKKTRDDDGPLKNEELVARLLESSTRSAEELQVRLVVDKKTLEEMETAKEESPPDTTTGGIMSLLDAIKTTNKLGVDLVAVKLDVPPGGNSIKNPPIVKAQDYEKTRYKKTKASQEAASKSKSKAVKVFKFRAGIAENDLRRKVQGMIKHLGAGHSCQVTLMARARLVEQSPTCLLDGTLEQVVSLVGEERATLQGTLKRNEAGTHGSIVMVPISPSKKKKEKKG